MKKFGLHIFGIILSGALSLFLLAFVLNTTIGSGSSIKSWLEDADTINQVVSNGLFLLEDVDLDDDIKRNIGDGLKEPIGENLLKPQVNSLIDQFYGWLNQRPKQPLKIKLDFSANNQEIRQALQEVIDDNFDDLPRCGGQQNDFLCREPGVSQGAFQNKLFGDLFGSDGPFTETTIEPEVGSRADINLGHVHSAKKVIGNLTLWLPILILVMAGLALYVSDDKLAGGKTILRYISGSLIFPVIISVAIFVFFPKEFNFNTELTDPESISAFSLVVTPLIRTIVFGVVKIYLLIALPILTGAIVGRIYLNRKLEGK